MVILTDHSTEIGSLELVSGQGTGVQTTHAALLTEVVVLLLQLNERKKTTFREDSNHHRLHRRWQSGLAELGTILNQLER